MKFFLEIFTRCEFVVGWSQRFAGYLLFRKASFDVLGIHGVALGAIGLVAFGALEQGFSVLAQESILESFRRRYLA